MELRDEMCASSENLEQQTLSPAANAAEELKVEVNPSEVTNQECATFTVPDSKAEIVNALVALLNEPIENVRDQV
ncbi:MAG: hypothetical protein HUJ90_00370, partial [Bacteroidales bacterium]|nr:hypothetical protein [Bacteroidales bacterium]